MAYRRHCPVCGQLLPLPAQPVCPNGLCQRSDRRFSVVFALGVYRGCLRRAITRFKYGGERDLAGLFAATLASYLRAHPVWFEEYDLITAVPAYTGPGARRRWDPVATVLGELAPRLGPAWSVEPGLVVKTRETPAMTGLGWSARQTLAQGALRDALGPRPGRDLEGTRVLVLDDVLTDGSTLREVARVLGGAGASEVAGLVLARPAWSPEPPGPSPPL